MRMLEIRAEQVEALHCPPRDVFIVRAARFLIDQLADHFGSMREDELYEVIERGVEAARRHGIVRRWDVCRFVVCRRILGEDFDTGSAHPWPRSVLAREDLSPTTKMDRIERHYLRSRIRRARAER